MRENFELNLCRVLAHSQVWESRQAEVRAGLTPGSVQANTSDPFGTNAPAPNVGNVAAQSLLAQMQAMRGIGPFAGTGSMPQLEAEFQPFYTNLALQGAGQYLNGNGRTPGMLSLYEQSIQPAMTRMQTAQRGSDIADVTSLTPALMTAMRGYNPQASGMLDVMSNQAQQQLNLNGALDPFTSRMLQQNIRSGQAARGMGTGSGDAAAEAYYLDAGRQQRRQQNLQTAAQVAGQNAAYYGDPFARILQGGNAGQSAAGIFGQGRGGYGGNLFSIDNNLTRMGYEGQLGTSMQNAQQRGSLFSNLVGGGLGMAAGAMRFI